MRLDKWLWVARFFKTRSLAKKAIENGKVQINCQSCKVSSQVKLEDTISIRQGFDEKIVLAKAFSEHRAGASEAALLFSETEDSIKKREEAARIRKTAGPHNTGRPTKRERRQIVRFLQTSE